METICCGSTVAVEFSIGTLIVHHSSFSFHFLSYLKVKISQESSLKTFSDKLNNNNNCIGVQTQGVIKWTFLLIKYVATERNHILYYLWL